MDHLTLSSTRVDKGYIVLKEVRVSPKNRLSNSPRNLTTYFAVLGFVIVKIVD